MKYPAGRHFLQIPGPSNVPDQVLRAIDFPTIDHRGPDFPILGKSCLDGMQRIFGTSGPVIIYPSSGTGAWEAALVNTLSAGDKVIVFDNGHFGAMWTKVARQLGVAVDSIPGDWREAPNPEALAERLRSDRSHEIRAVLLVHNETSTGVRSDVAAVRKALDAEHHPALLMVDAISSLGSMDYRHDQWGVDVSISASQKGLMMPPGLSFNAISAKALEATHNSKLPKSYWRWEDMLEANRKGFFPYTPSTNLLFGLREALRMLEEEGADQIFRRHDRHAEATRRAVRAWGLEVFARHNSQCSSALTAVRIPSEFNEVDLRAVILREFNMSLGAGLGQLAGKVFRIGHLGYFNDLTLAGVLCGIEMGLELAGVPHKKGGVAAAMDYLTSGMKAS